MTRQSFLAPVITAILASPAWAETTEKVVNVLPVPSGEVSTNWLLIAVLAAVAIVFFGVMIGGVISKSSS